MSTVENIRKKFESKLTSDVENLQYGKHDSTLVEETASTATSNPPEKDAVSKSNNSSEGNSYDAFDKLLANSTNNPHFKSKLPLTRTYSRNSCKNKKSKVKVCDKVVSFENDENRKKIVDWLNDNKNKFDRLTQTQQIVAQDIFNEESAASFNVPSISQQNSRHLNNLSCEHPFDDVDESMCYTRSLGDLMLDDNCCKVYLKRHTICCEYLDDRVKHSNKLNVDVEDVVLQMLEEKCLDNIDVEMSANNLEEKKVKMNFPRRCCYFYACSF